jgi:hypothetical protein
MNRCEARVRYGTRAIFWWVGVGVLLHVYHGGTRSLLTWKAAVFFFGGMFIAAFVVAEVNTWLQVIITGMPGGRKKTLDPSPERESSLGEGFVSNALQTGIAIAASWLTYHCMDSS